MSQTYSRGARSETIPRKGSRFGKWKFTGKTEKVFYGHTKAECICECGTKRMVILKDLKNGKSKSCGCVFVKHGLYKHPNYRNWVAMNVRCRNKDNKNYLDYGAKGIKVCKRWHITTRAGFENFNKDMGVKPSENHSIDRINNSKGYNPDNCRWADNKVQSNNRRNIVKHKEGHLFGWWLFLGEEKIVTTKTCSRYTYKVKCRCGRIGWRSKTSLTGKSSTKCKTCAMRLLFGKIDENTYNHH
jgi:hypothetical protein